MEAIIDTRIKNSVTFHDVLHKFISRRVMGTLIMEINITQDMASVYQNPLFLVLLDLRKAYDNLERGWLSKTLEGYGRGLKCGAFWSSSGRGRRWSPNKMDTVAPISGLPAEPHREF